MEAEAVWVGWTTVADAATARRLAEGLVGEGLAACVQIDGPVESHYRWAGALERAAEHRLVVKFAGARAAEIERWIGRNHPYESPQWLCVPACGGLENYLKWVVGNST